MKATTGEGFWPVAFNPSKGPVKFGLEMFSYKGDYFDFTPGGVH